AVLAAKYRFCRGEDFSRPRHQSLLNLLPRRNVGDRAYLDATFAALTCGRDLGGPGDCLVEVPAIENVVPGELFLRFGERAVYDKRPAILFADRCCRGRRLQRLAGDEDTLAPGFVHHRPMPRFDLLPVRRRCFGKVFLAAVDQKHIPHCQRPQPSMVQEERSGDGGGTASLTVERAMWLS